MLMVLQGAFRKVAAEAEACAKHLTKLLRQRLVERNDEAAECIQMVRKLGGPIESLQVWPTCASALLDYQCQQSNVCLIPW